MDKENKEEICAQRFLNWYNEQHNRNYICERATDHFSDLKDELNWDFVAYERDNLKEWIGIEVKEVAIVRETFIQFKFWKDLCSKLTRDLEGKGIQGEFGILPPPFNLKPEERPKFRKAFIAVLCEKTPNMKANEITDIGPDIASKFPNWPREKIKSLREYYEWGADHPSELLTTRSTDSGCKVSSLTSPVSVYDVPEAHKEAFNEVFKLKDDAIRANEQLKLAKQYAAKRTILLLACKSFVREGLIQNQVQNLDRHLISDIDYIYLVDVGNKDRVVKMYPS